MLNQGHMNIIRLEVFGEFSDILARRLNDALISGDDAILMQDVYSYIHCLVSNNGGDLDDVGIIMGELLRTVLALKGLTYSSPEPYLKNDRVYIRLKGLRKNDI